MRAALDRVPLDRASPAVKAVDRQWTSAERIGCQTAALDVDRLTARRMAGSEGTSVGEREPAAEGRRYDHT